MVQTPLGRHPDIFTPQLFATMGLYAVRIREANEDIKKILQIPSPGAPARNNEDIQGELGLIVVSKAAQPLCFTTFFLVFSTEIAQTYGGLLP